MRHLGFLICLKLSSSNPPLYGKHKLAECNPFPARLIMAKTIVQDQTQVTASEMPLCSVLKELLKVPAVLEYILHSAIQKKLMYHLQGNPEGGFIKCVSKFFILSFYEVLVVSKVQMIFNLGHSEDIKSVMGPSNTLTIHISKNAHRRET